MELKILEWVHLHHVPGLDHIVHVVTILSRVSMVLLYAGAVALALLYFRRRREAGIIFGGTFAGAFCIFALKHLVHRARPPMALRVHSYSFPSGHTLISTIFVLLMVWLGLRLYPQRKNLFYFFAGLVLFIVGLSRLYMGIHWPSDVLAGYLLGGLVSWAWLRVTSRSSLSGPW